MPAEPQKSTARFVAWAVIASGHIGLVWLFATADRLRQDHSRETEESLQMVLLPPLASDHWRPRQTTAPRLRPPRIHELQEREVPPISEPTAISLTPAGPQVDWANEAETVARSRSAATTITRNCDDTDRPSTQPKCKRSHSFQWNPEPSPVGIEGFLPYVRLGKRCVVGLGFFGCAAGELPGANGHLFDQLHDPDRPESSVPDQTK